MKITKNHFFFPRCEEDFKDFVSKIPKILLKVSYSTLHPHDLKKAITFLLWEISLYFVFFKIPNKTAVTIDPIPIARRYCTG